MKTNISSGKPVTPVFGTNDSPLINPQELSCPAQKKFVPRSLCRCGHSGHKPFCDGNHANVNWLPTLKAPSPLNGHIVRL